MTLSQFRASESVSQFSCLSNGVQSTNYLSPYSSVERHKSAPGRIWCTYGAKSSFAPSYNRRGRTCNLVKSVGVEIGQRFPGDTLVLRVLA